MATLAQRANSLRRLPQLFNVSKTGNYSNGSSTGKMLLFSLTFHAVPQSYPLDFKGVFRAKVVMA